jgi:hypothetical protein
MLLLSKPQWLMHTLEGVALRQRKIEGLTNSVRPSTAYTAMWYMGQIMKRRIK